MNLAQTLADTAAKFPQTIALKLDAIELDYATTEQLTARVATMLGAHNIGVGDRVALMMPNVPHFEILYYGILRTGASVVPFNVLCKQREIDFFLSDSSAKLIFAWHDFAGEAQAAADAIGIPCIDVMLGEFEPKLFALEPAQGIVERADDDTAVVLYSSGTTGTPKGAELTHANMYSNAMTCADIFAIEHGTVMLGALPLFHVFGQTCAMNTAVMHGGTLSLLPRFDGAKALEIIERDRIEIFEGVPTMYAAMLGVEDPTRFDVSSLRICVSGGAALPIELLRGFEAQFPCKILEGYGLSETSPVVSFNRPDRERKAGSIGIPIDRVEVKVVDEFDAELPVGEPGELVVRGPNVMKSYLNMEQATELAKRGGWLHTGDIARIDEDGYIFIVDRKKDMIIRGGYNIYPREVEEVLYEHPAVREAAVYGVPDSHYGEEVAATVSLKPGMSATEDELKAFAKSQVAAYKYPRTVKIVADLPKGPTGKILKREIRDSETSAPA